VTLHEPSQWLHVPVERPKRLLSHLMSRLPSFLPALIAAATLTTNPPPRVGRMLGQPRNTVLAIVFYPAQFLGNMLDRNRKRRQHELRTRAVLA